MPEINRGGEAAVLRLAITVLLLEASRNALPPSIGGSIAMTVHFTNQYGNSKAVPLMFIEMTTGGTMWFFVAVTSIGLGWVWFFLPETSKRSLESLDELFNLPWQLIGRKGAQLTEDRSHLAVVEKEEALEMEYVHEVPNKRMDL